MYDNNEKGDIYCDIYLTNIVEGKMLYGSTI